MDISQYFIRLTGSALICASLGILMPAKGTVGNVMKLLRGIFMVLCLIQPLTDLSLDSWQDYWKDFRDEGTYFAAQGETSSRNAMAAIITERTQTYIQDKAASLGADIAAEVFLSADAIPVPCGVTVTGDLSPYAKAELSDYITDELGIPREAQIWQQP